MKILILIGFLVFLFTPVHALEISEYQVTSYIVGNQFQEEVTFRIKNNQEEPLTKFTYPFGGILQNLTVYDSEGKLEYSSKYTGEKTYVKSILRKPLPTGGEYWITYKFYMDGQVTQKEGTYILSTSHSLLANVKNFGFTIALPEGYGVTDHSVSPTPEGIMSDGRRVILEWNLEEPIPAALREFNAIVLYENLLGERHPWWKGREDYIYIAIIVTILAASIYLSKRLKKKQTNEKIEILKEDEQAIMRLIIEKDGIDQRDIQKETDFSKTKVSKILSELEKRGAIRKEQVGRRNRIFLTKKLREP